jgi:UDP-N-acetyl-D-glucosamine dehydrogenase
MIDKQLQQRLSGRTARIAVIGLGYVGLPLAVEFADRGYRTIGIDVDPLKIASLRKGKNYIPDIDNARVARLVKSRKLRATSSFDVAADADAVFICVPTPFTPNKEPDISYIIDAANAVAPHVHKGQVIVLKSTTFPGTTDTHVQPILERVSRLKAGKDFHLAFAPERVDPGNEKWNTANTPLGVGGVSHASTAAAAAVLRTVIAKVVEVSGPRVAEMEKLLENIFRSVNIALVNELAQLCDRMGGINMWEVVEAASTKPFGFMPFYPGPGIGGHCILIDPYYLEWYARQFDFHTNFIALAAEVNESMPFYVRDMVLRELSRAGVRPDKAKVLFLGVAFKKNVDDTRHSPALMVMELLQKQGLSHMKYNDPFVPSVKVGAKLHKSVSLTAASVKQYDLVVITTDHAAYDMRMIVKNARRVVDTRNATKGVRGRAKKVVLLGSGA